MIIIGLSSSKGGYMHEMSIAMNVVEIVTDTAKKNKAKKINLIELDVGALSGIIPDALEFCFESACKGTIAENSELKLNLIKADAECENCSNKFKTAEMVSKCPKCGEMVFQISGGRELKVRAINVD